MSAAINENLANAQTIVNESGPVTIGEYTIRTWNDSYHGPITATQILQYSSNVGMVHVSRILGKEREIKYIKNYGIGQQTNVDLQEESSPEMRPVSSWVDIDYATASFGQGIAVTPLQLVRAIGAIANGGALMEPKVVKEIVDKRGKKVEIKPNKVRQIITTDAARQIKDMMIDAVKFGEAKWARPKGYKVAGKTGTAQIPVAGHYDPTKTIASFVGFAPADNPRFVMLVILNQPQSSEWGSETAAPLFFTIAKDLFAYMGIAPTGDD
jgi:cell division protein FtsI/penicillin-binding protein 2